MLDKVPHEVILSISNFLTLKNKLILITTCRHLYNVVSNTNLLSNINLLPKQTPSDYTKMVEKFLEDFKNSDYSGSQVRVLSINITKISPQLVDQLFDLFPNITRIITYEHSYFSGPTQRHIDQGLLPLPWIHKLEIYNMQYDWPALLPLLKTTRFPRLRELDLGFYYYLEDRSKGFNIPYFLPHIRNAPSLKKLVLRDCAIDLEFLDQVHASCPQLESLRLTLTHILIRNQTLNQPVVPAVSLLSLEIEKACCFDPNGLFLEYITRKYRCLNHLTLSFYKGFDDGDFQRFYKGKRISKYLDKPQYNVENESDPEIRENVRIYLSLKDEYESTLSIYKKSGERFFSNLAKSVKCVEMRVDFFYNIMQVLANSNTGFTKLKFGESELKDSKQLAYINDIKGLRSLQLDTCIIGLRSLVLETCIIKQHHNDHFPPTNITQLTFGVRNKYISLNWLLSMFPSLEELRINGETELIMTENGVCKHHPNLKEIHCKWGLIDQECFDYLKTTAPNIQDMTIQIKKIDDITIDISDWDLKRLEIVSEMTSFYCNITTPSGIKDIKYDRLLQSLAWVRNRSYSRGNAYSLVIRNVSTKEKRFMFNGYSIVISQDKISIDG